MSLLPDYESSTQSDSGSNKEKVVGAAETAGETVINRGDAREECFKVLNGDSQGIQNGAAQNVLLVKQPAPSSVTKRKISSENSVLANEYKKEEENKTQVLEQHVKMVSNQKSVPVNGKVNGKKVCWMYRRGRCRLGKKCKMYHDRELRIAELKQIHTAEKNTIEQPVHTPSPQKRGYEETVTDESDNRDEPKKQVHKKRFGVDDGIVPPKYVIQPLERVTNNEN